MNRKLLNKIRDQRKKRTRAVILGTLEKPRLSIFKSNSHIYLQLIDDEAQKTIISVSSRGLAKTNNVLEKLGSDIAEKALKKGISKAVMDRGAYKFHGVVKAVAESAKKSGLKL